MSRPRSNAAPTVTVVGAGVAGLTAAHALAERGFTVFVVESVSGSREDLEPGDIRVGGVASSHPSQISGLFAFDSGRPGRQVEGGAPRLGFRQVPRHFRHVRDVLRAIPIDGARGRTLADTLTRVRVRTVGHPLGPFLLPEGPLAGAGVGSGGQSSAMPSRKDLLVYSCRLLRYMSTCAERRRAECEDISFAEYVRGHNSRQARVPLVYEERFLTALDHMPRGLAVLDPAHIDARTGLNLVEQLVFDLLDAPSGVDVLSGPTDESWFLPWQQHLVRLGVTFHHATLDRLSLVRGQVRPHFTKRGRAWRGAAARLVSDADYLVLAVDAVSAERLVHDLPDVGVPAGLRGFTTIAPPDPRDRHGVERRRDPVRQSPLDPADRLQAGVGLQFYFRHDIEPLHGLTYISGSPWNLVTFMDPQPRERRGSPRDDPSRRFALRVDICAWNAPGLAGHPPPSRSARHDLALEAWRQIKAVVGAADGDVADPVWYRIDRNIRFADARQGRDPADGSGVDGDGIPVANHAPCLMPVTGDWDDRPGSDPWDPKGIGAARPFDSTGDGIWQADHGGYLMHWGRLVFAGSYTRTFTRVTTLESACESARHAVNAILDHHRSTRGDGRHSRTTQRAGTSGEAAPDYCLVSNPERSVLHGRPTRRAADLERVLSLAKSVDRQAFGLGRPHCWETLFFDRYLATLAKGGVADPTDAFGGFVKSFYSKLQGLAGRAAGDGTDWAATLADAVKALTDLRGILAALDNLVRPPSGRRK